MFYNENMMKTTFENAYQPIFPIMETVGLATHLQSALRVKTHTHNSYIEITYVVGGEIEHTINKATIPQAVGDCIIYLSGASHSIENPNNGIWRDIMVSSDIFQQILAFFPDQPFFNTKTDHIFFHLSNSNLIEINRLAQQFTAEGDPIKKRCLGIEMVLKILYEHETSPRDNFDKLPPMIKKICTNLDKEFFLKSGIAKILEDSQYSHSYVCHMFKKHMGISLSEYIISKRLDTMVYYLINTDYSLTEIGNRIGVESLSYLNRMFKKKYMIPPIQYRKLYSKKGEDNE